MFTGLAFNGQMEQILKMLSEYNVKAIKKAGHEISNYGLEAGEIVCVKLNDTLDDIEYEELEVDEQPAIDFEDNLGNNDEQKEEELDIVVTVEYLLESLRATETAVVSLERLYIDWDKQLESLFSSIDDTAQYQVEESETVLPTYLKDTLFMGDSLTQTLALNQYPNALADLSSVCAYKSITINQTLNNVRVENTNVLDEILGQSPKKLYFIRY